jgi:hypothetical protein
MSYAALGIAIWAGVWIAVAAGVAGKPPGCTGNLSLSDRARRQRP